jgi:hypothetical protein
VVFIPDGSEGGPGSLNWVREGPAYHIFLSVNGWQPGRCGVCCLSESDPVRRNALTASPGRSGFVFDARQRTLMIYRGPVGLVPLSIAQADGCIVLGPGDVAVASILQASFGESPQVERRSIESVICGGRVESNLGFLDCTSPLRPGHILTFRGGRHSTKTSVRFSTLPTDYLAPGDDEQKVKEWLAGAVEIEAQCPTIMLSSGVDSGLLAAQLRASRPGAMLYSGTLGQGDSVHDESELAADVAKTLSLEHVSIDGSMLSIDLEEFGERISPDFGPVFHPTTAYFLELRAILTDRHSSDAFVIGNGLDDVVRVSRHEWLRDGTVLRRGRLPAWLRSFDSVKQVAQDVASLLGVRESVGQAWTSFRSGNGTAPAYNSPVHWLRTSMPRKTDDSKQRHSGRIDRLLARLRSIYWEATMRSIWQLGCEDGIPTIAPFLDWEFWVLCMRIRPTRLYDLSLQKKLFRTVMASMLRSHTTNLAKHGPLDPLVQQMLSQNAAFIEALFLDSELEHLGLIDAAVFRERFGWYLAASRVDPGSARFASLPFWRTISAEMWLRRVDTGLQSLHG